MDELDPIKRVRRLPEFGDVFTKEMLENVRKQTGKILLACDNDIPVGFICGLILVANENQELKIIPSKTGYIDKFYINKEYRGKGIGKELILQIEDYLKSVGCDSVWLEADAFNSNAYNFYKKGGYLDREIGMLKQLNK